VSNDKDSKVFSRSKRKTDTSSTSRVEETV